MSANAWPNIVSSNNNQKNVRIKYALKLSSTDELVLQKLFDTVNSLAANPDLINDNHFLEGFMPHEKNIIVYNFVYRVHNPKTKCKLLINKQHLKLLLVDTKLIVEGIEFSVDILEGIEPLAKIQEADGAYYLTIHKHNHRTVGIRPEHNTWLVCIDSYNNTIRIGTNLDEKFGKYIRFITRTNDDKKMTVGKKKRFIERKLKKINNLVNELHIRSMNYLASNYQTILIGDFNSNAKYDDNDYRKYLNYDAFIKKLVEKCEIKQITTNVIKAELTTKLCSSCSSYNIVCSDCPMYICSSCNAVVGEML